MMLAVSFVMTVAAAIARLVSAEVLGRTTPPVTRPVAITRVFPAVAVIRMEVIVYMSAEVVTAMKPRSCTDEDTAAKPFGTVVAIGSAAIRSDIVIAIGTSRCYTDINADLGLCSGSTCCNAETSDGGQSEKFYSAHKFTSSKLEKDRG